MYRILSSKDSSDPLPSKYGLYGCSCVTRHSTLNRNPGNLPLEGIVQLRGYVAGTCTSNAAAVDYRNDHGDNAVWISSPVPAGRRSGFPDRRHRRLTVI